MIDPLVLRIYQVEVQSQSSSVTIPPKGPALPSKAGTDNLNDIENAWNGPSNVAKKPHPSSDAFHTHSWLRINRGPAWCRPRESRGASAVAPGPERFAGGDSRHDCLDVFKM
jgi:hypothetical protein